MNRIITSIYHSPAGDMLLGSYDGKLCLCDWNIPTRRPGIDGRISRYLNTDFVEGRSDVIDRTIIQLDEYFTRQRTTFDIPLLFCGSEFQCRVWNELLNIPYGDTASYKELAQKISNPDAVRAVASANASNAISILVPCHRVIGSNGKLTGYAGGLEAKRLLLDLESRFIVYSLWFIVYSL